MGLHVLVVARWYPAYDNPGRGSFVADHVAALTAAGVRVTVASFEAIPIRGDEETRAARLSVATERIAAAIQTGVRAGWATSVPRSWGARGVPVARLPVITDPVRRGPAETVDAHAAALLPFGRALADDASVDLVHAHTGLPDGIASARLADALGAPLVVTEHSSTVAAELADDRAREMYAALIAPGRRVAAVSASLAGEVAALVGADPTSLGVLPNAVPVDRFALGDPAARNQNELLYVAARRAAKGIETGLRALALVRERRPEIRLRLIGAPGLDQDEARWAALVDELGLGEAVLFEGPRERDAVAEAMRRAGAFMHPSGHETFGMVAAEALATGLPVAATPSGGVDGIVGSDGRFGEIAADTSPEALAAAVIRLLERRDSFDPPAMRASIAERFAPAAIARQTLDLYERALAERRLVPLARTDSGSAAATVEGAGTSRVTSGTRDGSHQAGTLPGMHRAGTRPASRQAGSPPGTHRRPPAMIAGFGRTLTVDRVGDLPADVRATLAVATRGKPNVGPEAPAVGRWRQLDLDGEYVRRLAALRRRGGSGLVDRIMGTIRAPRSYLRRRRMLADPDGSRRRIFVEFLEDAGRDAAALSGDGNEPDVVLVVPIEADDALTIGSLLGGALVPGTPIAGLTRILPGGRARLRLGLAPGTLRWLVDRTNAASDAGDRQ